MRPERERFLCVTQGTEVADRLRGLLAGAETYAVETALGALKLARDSVFDLYVVGAHLPEMRGAALCRRIREFDANTPILMCFHDGEEAAHGPIDPALAQGFITNPVDPYAAPHAIRTALAAARTRSVAAQTAELAAIQDEVATRLRQSRDDLARARTALMLAHEAVMMARGYDAFAAAGGTRSDFRRMWPEVLAKASGGQAG